MLAAVEYVVLGGGADGYGADDEGWEAFRAIVADNRELVERFVREQPVQTNEPQRCWALLPLFLEVARTAQAPLELLELGTSAGLNLLWDRYGYEYEAAAWGRGDAPLVLRGEERGRVPRDLLATAVDVRGRRGVDLAPVDATHEDGLRLLLSFSTREEYRERVRRAAEAVRAEPPELVRGDYVERLPELLAERADDAITVVFQTISTVYLEREAVERLRAIVDEAARGRPLAWISTPTPAEHGLRGGGYPLELAVWPWHGRRLVAETANAAEWLDWRGV